MTEIELSHLRCAVIGCGRIGCGFDDRALGKRVVTHAGSYYANPQTDLIAFCDLDKKKLKKYGKKYSVSDLYTSSLQMFKNENLDLVSISTLADSHWQLVKEAVAHGIKGIFLEKPISYNIQTAKKIIKLCNKNNVKLLINHQRRFDPFYHQIKQFLQTGKLGSLQMVDVYYGEGIANTGSHFFDLLRFFFGDVKSVKGTFSRISNVYKPDPNIDGILKFKSGLNCNIHAVGFKKFILLEMNIIGSAGRLQLNMIANLYQANYYKPVYKKKLRTSLLEEFPSNFKKPKKSAIYYGVENLVNCFKNNTSILSTGEDGCKALAIVIAFILSANKNKKINLPVSNTHYRINSK